MRLAFALSDWPTLRRLHLHYGRGQPPQAQPSSAHVNVNRSSPRAESESPSTSCLVTHDFVLRYSRWVDQNPVRQWHPLSHYGARLGA